MFDNVQPCSTNVQPIWACGDCLWPNMAILGQKRPFSALLRPPTDISGWAKRPKLTPPEVENIIQPCSPNVQPIWGCRDCLWPNMAFFSLKKAILGGSRAPNDISVWSKRPKLIPPDVENNVQPCSPNVQPIWGRWDCLWPNIAILDQKKVILGGSRAPQ